MTDNNQGNAEAASVHDDKVCLVCSRDSTLWSSLREVIAESRQWLETHPPVSGDYPSSNNLKQMLIEACDFAATTLDCVIVGRVAPMYTNFRCLLERAHYAIHFVSRDNAMWEYQSIARQQEAIDRQLSHTPSGEREWAKERLAGIRHWNRQPDEDGKPTSMGKHTKYAPGMEEMNPHMRSWYEASSLHVHPTYMWEKNIGRPFLENETEAVVVQAHMYLCLISLSARGMDAIVTCALQGVSIEDFLED